MATSYPDGLDNFTNPTASDYLDSATVPHATQHANANDAIEAIETELGTDPKGTYASVKARLDAATPNDTANEVVKRDANGEFVAGAVTIDTTKTPTSAPGKLYWDGGQTVNLGLGGGNVSIALGQEVVQYVTNAEATTLNVGEVVYLFGAQGDRASVKRASNTSDATSSKTFGIVAESITANGAGFVVNKGVVQKMNTAAYNPGDILYLGATAGTVTTTKPVAPNHLVFVGVVLRANAGNGLVFVSPQNGYELDEIHDVLITSKTDGQFLSYESSSGLWKNKSITATAPITYDASTRTIAANAASTFASGVVQLSDSTSTTSSVLASTPTATKAAFDLATTANATANAAIPLAQKAAANGVATLDSSGLVPSNQLPAIAITNTFVVASQAAMLALTAQTGDVAIRTDLSQSFILTADPASTLANWQQLLSPPDAVTSVDGRVGAVTLTDKYAQLATANTFTGGVQQITTASASTIGQIIKGSTSQTVSLQQWQDSTGAVQASMSAAGSLSVNYVQNLGVTGGYLDFLTNSPRFVQRLSTSIGVIVRGAASQSANLQEWQDSTATVLASVNASGFGTFGNLTVTSSSAPVNGIYLPTTNTLGFVTNSILQMRINATGNIGVGTAPVADRTMVLGKTITGATGTYGLVNNGVIQSDVTSQANLYYSGAITANANFNITTIRHYFSDQGSFSNVSAGGTVTNQTAFEAGSSLTGATNNYGFFGNIPSAANRWNAYMVGTAANYFAGQTTVGSTSLTLGGGSVAQQFGVVSAAASNVVAVIRGAASQSGSLTQWQNSAGSVLTSVDSGGSIITTVGLFGNDFNNTSSGNNARLQLTATGSLITTGLATNTALRIQNTNASQSGDLVQLQNSSGTVLDSFDNNGNQRSQAQLIQYGAEGSVLQNIPTRVHPAETLLKQAVWWIDSAHSGSSGQAIKNLGWGGSALDVTAGSSTSADTNDPLYLAWDGVNYAYLPGVASNYLSVPDSAALQVVGDMDIRVQVSLDDWTPAATQNLISKWSGGGTSGQRSWILSVGTSGTLTFTISDTAFTVLSISSTVAPTVTDGTPLWVRVAYTRNTGAGQYSIVFFTSNNGTTWTQLGTTLTGTSILSTVYSTSPVELGTIFLGATGPTAGKVYRAQILNGIDGVPVLDVDTSIISSGSATTFTALTGQTVTINRATSGRKTTCVTHPVWLFGTDDYMEVNNRWLEHTGTNYLYLPGVTSNYASAPDSAALDITGDIDLRAKVALDDWTPAATANLISKNQAGAPTYYLNVQTTGALRLMISLNGTAETIATSTVVNTIPDGTTKWVRATRVASTGVVQFFTSDDGSTWTQLGADVSTTSGNIAATTAFLEIGTTGFGGGAGFRGKFFRAQVLNGIGGTTVFDANFETGITTNLPTSFTESSANAATVTINYSGTAYRSAGVIASTYVFPGNPNTFKLSSYSMLDFGASDDFTVLTFNRLWNTPTSSGTLIGKRTVDANWGYVIRTNATAVNPQSYVVSNGTLISNTVATTVTAGTMQQIGTIINRGTNTIATLQNGTIASTTSISTVGSVANVATLQVGALNVGANAPQDFEFVSAAIFRRALTAAEIATLNSYFQGRVA